MTMVAIQVCCLNELNHQFFCLFVCTKINFINRLATAKTVVMQNIYENFVVSQMNYGIVYDFEYLGRTQV